MNIPRQTFGKSEKLCSTKIISGLFESGNIFYNSLFKVVWGTCPVILPAPAQVAFSVSKRGFRLAVTRNLIKRRMREAYRKNKKILYDYLLSQNIQIALVVILKGTSVPDYVTVEKAISDMIKNLMILNKEKQI